MRQNDTREESRETLKDEKAKYKKAVSKLAGNWAKIASAAVVILSYTQYSFKYGVCKVFNLPITTIEIRLSDFIPGAALLCFTALYVHG